MRSRSSNPGGLFYLLLPYPSLLCSFSADEQGELKHEQLSIFLGHRTVLTFQDSRDDYWDPIRQRIRMKGSRLRGNDASFLAYSLLDAVVDGCFPILEQYSERAEALEAMILEGSKPDLLSEVHQLKRDLLLLRWVVWPMRELVQVLQARSEQDQKAAA